LTRPRISANYLSSYSRHQQGQEQPWLVVAVRDSFIRNEGPLIKFSERRTLVRHNIQFHIQEFGPGESIQDPRPGDFALTRGHDWTSFMIRVGERLRYRGPNRKYAYWNHALLFVDDKGGIIEALGSGVTPGNISKYTPVDYHVVRLDGVSDGDRLHEVAFGDDCVAKHREYGYLTIVSIALSLLFGGRLGFGIDGQEICSGLVARALERTGEIFEIDSWHMMPADLAAAYQVEPPVQTVSAN